MFYFVFSTTSTPIHLPFRLHSCFDLLLNTILFTNRFSLTSLPYWSCEFCDLKRDRLKTFIFINAFIVCYRLVLNHVGPFITIVFLLESCPSSLS